MADVDALKSDLERLRSSVNEQFGAVREDLRELTAAFRELIRMDGDMRRINDALARIGAQVDDHEKRLRLLENGHAADGVRIGGNERIVWLFVTVAAGLLTYFLTH